MKTIRITCQAAATLPLAGLECEPEEQGDTARARMNGKPVFSVPARSVLNLDSGFKHKLLCDGPTFSAGSACAYSCTFCYVEDLMRKNPHWQEVQKRQPGLQFSDVVIRREAAIEALRKQLTYADGSPRFADLNDRRVIYASPLVDVAANMDLVRETVEMCKVIFELTNWQIRLLSKSNLLPKVAECLAFNSSRLIFGVSTGTLDDKLTAAFELGTPLVSKRIESLHWLQDNGFRTFGMICPSLPQWIPGVNTWDAYLKFADEMAEALRADKCEHVWAEVINLRGESFTRTEESLRCAGYGPMADELHRLNAIKSDWEDYARLTFRAHSKIYGGQTGPDGLPKLRFLQYVTKDSRPWWQTQKNQGAICL
jgi:DNA repair photolyase